jgi:RNA polymerase sigma-70 factor (ECF subfamily)
MDGGSGVSDTIVDLARCGDESAWSVLFKDLAPAVAAYFRARRMVEAEDLTGEVFLEVARRIGSFEGGAAGFRAWVFTIAHSRFVDAVRSLERRPTASLEDIEEPIAPVDVAGEATRNALRERLLAATDVLSPDQRSVLLLRVFADLSIAETAQAIGKSTVAVKVHLHRAIKALERELAPPVSGAPDVPHRARVGTVPATQRFAASVAPTEGGEA